ncbi:TetR family transcriptional regulator [Mycobacterium sp. OTB74]|jgi:AcrR family transcriptional regulator|uniref:TetR/AcrR family transcriptional regulator n=1 Tax=Mycobacterium sp. OTB74 TaxID=1853452 RepID=UPI002476FA9C|nr:TetR family transcriptional regulator [Mycobacterium sp. OTB74]MDH6244675.1 AcrR family transcriptional regulator [Mycobacterium sp. OTB74]
MVRDDWVVGGDRRAAAADRIYAAATDLVVRDGLDAFDIDTLAARVHCSRATIYRYTGGKAQIRDAVLMRLATGIIDTVRHAVDGLDGPDRVVTAIVVALKQIRVNPLRRLLLGARNSVEFAELQDNPILSQLAAELTGTTDPQAARWIVHVVLSLTQRPIGDDQTEEQMIRKFVAPAFGA